MTIRHAHRGRPRRAAGTLGSLAVREPAATAVGGRQLGGQPSRVRAGARRERALPRGGGRRAGRVRHRLARGSRREDRRPVRRRRGRAGRERGSALVETVIENLRARGATHLFLNANLQALVVLREARLPGGVAQPGAAARAALGGGGPFVRVDPRAVGRSRRGRARRPAVRAPAAGRLARKQRHAAAQRLDHGLRRRLRSRSVGAAPPRRPNCRNVRARSCSRSASSTSRSSASSCSRRVASSTSTSPFRSTTARCRRAMRSRSPRIRASSRDSPARIPPSSARPPARPRAPPSSRPRASYSSKIAAAIGLEGADHGWEGAS